MLFSVSHNSYEGEAAVKDAPTESMGCAGGRVATIKLELRLSTDEVGGPAVRGWMLRTRCIDAVLIPSSAMGGCGAVTAANHASKDTDGCAERARARTTSFGDEDGPAAAVGALHGKIVTGR